MRKHRLNLIFIIILTFGFFLGVYASFIENETTCQIPDNTQEPSIGNLKTSSNTWSHTEVISDNVNGTKNWNTGDSKVPSIAVDGSNNLHVVWYDSTNLEGCGTDNDIFYANYSATTGKWSNTTVISDNVNGTKDWNKKNSESPDIAVDGFNNLHVVWGDLTNLEGCGDLEQDIFYANYSTTTGKWSNTSVISDNVNGTKNWNKGSSNDPKIVVDGSNNLHVVWHDYTNLEGCGTDSDIFYVNYSVTTGKWSNTSVISDNVNGTKDWNKGSSFKPNIAVNGSYLHVVWYDETNLEGCGTDSDIFYANYSTITGKWSNTSVISDNVNGTKDWNNGLSERPDIAVNGSNLHVVWHDYTDLEGCGGDPDIFYANYSATTGNWSHASVISDNVNGTKNWNTGDSKVPSIAVDGSDNLHVVWHDETNLEGCSVDPDIFYTSYSAATGKWSHTSVISDNVNGTKNWNTGNSIDADIAVDGFDNLHVVWYDYTDLEGCGTDSDIFYVKRYPLRENRGIILSDSESNGDDEKKEDLNLLILMAFIFIAVIITSFTIYLFKKRNTVKKTTDLNLTKKTFPKNDDLNLIKTEMVEDDIIISKEKHFCLVHKGPIEGYNFVCECGTYYCVRCIEAIKEIENACWSCGKVLDETKPIKKVEEKVKNIDILEEKGVSKGIKPDKKKKNHKN